MYNFRNVTWMQLIKWGFHQSDSQYRKYGKTATSEVAQVTISNTPVPERITIT